MATEAINAKSEGLDLQPPLVSLRLLAEAQVAAAAVVFDAVQDIARAAGLAADGLASGGRLFYAAAGSSALMALADALELPGTFGIPRDRIIVLLAGGANALVDLAGAPEDDAAQAARDLAGKNIGSKDCLIAISASGTTPYAVAALTAARRAGATTIGIANNSSTPVTLQADVGIVLATPPELIAGSTRMGAGTAQKIALNMLSTQMAIHLGHVHDGYMINLHADNNKLRGRAARIVAAIAGCPADAAETLLARSGGSVKTAVLLAAGADSAKAANDILSEAGQKLRPALERLKEGSSGSRHNGT